MWIKREIQGFLGRIAKQKPVLVLSGARQTGKSSLLQNLFAPARYVTLDLPRDAEMAEQNGEVFLEQNPPPVIIDEIQYAPGILPYIKVCVDKHRQKNGRFFLTGSQKFNLMHGVTESLAGRAAILECHSLSAREWARHSKKKLERKGLLDWIVQGGYPEIHAKRLDAKRFHADYLSTYLERDVRQITQVRDLRDFDRFLRLCALRSGQLFSYSALAAEVGVSAVTIKSWVSILEASNIICLLEPYFSNRTKRLVKAPKLYFLDTGMLCYLLGVHASADLLRHPQLGAVFETHAVGQILRHFAARGERAPIFFYRDHDGHEIDVVIEQAGRVILAECKWSETPNLALAGFTHFSKKFGEDKILSRHILNPLLGNTKTKSGVFLNDSVELGFLK